MSVSRPKTVIISYGCVQTDSENRQLRSKVKQLSTTQNQNKVCIDQLVSRLQEVECLRRSERHTNDALRQQVDAYREDFEGERLDRRRAQEKALSLERQLAALKQRVRVVLYYCSIMVTQ